MKRLLSGRSSTLPSAAGWVKLGQPVPDSNLASEGNSSAPQPPQVYIPVFLLSRSSPVNGRSVPFSRRMWNCLGRKLLPPLLLALVDLVQRFLRCPKL